MNSSQGFLGSVFSWAKAPFQSNGSALDWILFVGLLVIAASTRSQRGLELMWLLGGKTSPWSRLSVWPVRSRLPNTGGSGSKRPVRTGESFMRRFTIRPVKRRANK